MKKQYRQRREGGRAGAVQDAAALCKVSRLSAKRHGVRWPSTAFRRHNDHVKVEKNRHSCTATGQFMAQCPFILDLKQN